MTFWKRGKPGNLVRGMMLLLCLLILSAGVFPVRSFAADGEAEVVRVGYYDNEVFQEGGREGAVKTGYAYEYYRKLSEYTGWKYEYVYGDFGDIYQMFLDGDVDLLAGLAYREERTEQMWYPDEIMGRESYYRVKHGSIPEITADPATLNGRKIGVLDSAMVSVLNEYLTEHQVEAEVIPFQSNEELLRAFNSRELEVIVGEGSGP